MTALVVVLPMETYVSRRFRLRRLSAVIGLDSTQDYPVVTAGLRVAAFALNNRQPS
jgi:hypothetical protein